jgi:hypothetical protein
MGLRNPGILLRLRVLFRILLWCCIYNLQNVILQIVYVYIRSLFLVDTLAANWIRRKLHHEELHDLFSSQNIITTIKWRRMRRTGHAARIGEMRIT